MNPLHERLGAALDGDAARYNGADFADARLGSVLGSVKRRRAARAAGVSSVSLLGAGALAVGASNVSWSWFASGVTPAGSPSVLCTTTTPDAVAEAAPTSGTADGADFVVILEMGEDTPPVNETSPDGITKSDPGTPGSVSWAVIGGDDATNVAKASMDGDTLVVDTPVEGTQRVSPSADGSYHFTLNGNAVVWTISDDDQFEVTISMPGSDGAASDAPAPAASSSPSVDCVTTTPEPTESASPSPSASPTVSASAVPEPSATQEVSADTPFQCGYVFETDKGGSDNLQIFGSSTTDSEIHSIFDEWYGNQEPTTEVGDTGAVAFRAALAPAEVHGATSTRDPASDESVAAARDYDMPSVGFTFVAVRDGAVVGTVTPGANGQTPGVVVDRASADGAEEAFMWDLDALTPCGTTSLEGAQIYAVAGYGQDGTYTYAWHILPE